MCPLCGLRKARRSCPALGHAICAVCCGTKRLTEIKCPISCVYLSTSREHPAAAEVRKQRADVALLTRTLQDLNDRQARLLVEMCSSVTAYKPSEFQRLSDADVEEAFAAMAATLETASRGVIYQHTASSASANRLSSELRPLIERAIQGGGTSAERDAAFCLRRGEELVRSIRAGNPEHSRAFLDWLHRVLAPRGAEDRPSQEPVRLIVP